ncbi:ribosomal-protein-alanine N-acetyltransferase [Youhaiella tibetensis]|uniref:GNAT family N-acetyltransferase n=1 Tax=Paradevosia tibetensis TaxID=1447062 RepID=A0A5B9DK95_9HYPH|nr:GNAT family protein [Youhaiella tibetensis]QEE19614.1 GNAT family N-acetyltransferase [Youhaiella tibetensis]GGF31508.1 ribosomal-protein-alanine N-acetyltransferase [Youhaiella tibetensis]
MLWPWSSRDKTPELHGERVILRAPQPHDYKEWRALRHQSRSFLKPFEPRWTEADLGRSVYFARLRRGKQEAEQGTDFTFFIFVMEGDRQKLVGGMTLSNIRRRAAQFVTLGYWMGEPFAGQGYMTEAVGAVLPFVFDTLGLHRIHAAFLPDNLASRRVLEKNGFKEEGYADKYLQIDGKWADHVLFGLTREHYEARRRRRFA